MKSLITVGLFLMLMSFCCCKHEKVSEEQAWGQITHYQVMDQPDSLLAAVELYLDQHAEGPHAIMVQQLKDRIMQEKTEWEKMMQEGATTQQVETYLGKYHDGFYRTAALQQLDHLDYTAAVDENTPEAYDLYLKLHPDGLHLKDALTRYNRSIEKVTKLTEKEEKEVRSLLHRHFAALQNADEAILETVDETLSYFGKHNATQEDVIAYMTHSHKDKQSKVFKADSIHVRKVSNQKLPVYNASFLLTEIINPNDTAKLEKKQFIGTAAVNSEFKITSLTLKAK